MAARLEHVEFVEVLVEAGIDANAEVTDSHYNDAIQAAAPMGCLEIV